MAILVDGSNTDRMERELARKLSLVGDALGGGQGATLGPLVDEA